MWDESSTWVGLMTDFPNRIIHILRSCPNGLSSKDIAERLGTTQRNLSSRLSKLAAYGIIGRVRGSGRARHKGSNLQSTLQCGAGRPGLSSPKEQPPQLQQQARVPSKDNSTRIIPTAAEPPARRGWGTPSSERGEPGGTSGSTHGLGYLFTAFRRQGLIADERVLQLTTFLRSLDLFLELIFLDSGNSHSQPGSAWRQATHR